MKCRSIKPQDDFERLGAAVWRWRGEIFPARERSISQSEPRRACCSQRCSCEARRAFAPSGYPTTPRREKERDVVGEKKRDHGVFCGGACSYKPPPHLTRVVVMARIPTGRDPVEADPPPPVPARTNAGRSGP